MACGKELGKNPMEEFNLPRCPDELLVNEATRTDLVLDTLEQEGVLANLAELHEFVAEPLDAV